MKIAIVAATELELAFLRNQLPSSGVLASGIESSLHATGVGMLHTAVALQQIILQEQPSFMVMVGIAGAYDVQRYPAGSAVCVERDCQADLGVYEEGRNWHTAFQKNWIEPNAFPYSDGWLINPYDEIMTMSGLDSVKAATVNQVSTDGKWIEDVSQILAPDIETMEGAAFHLTCLAAQIPFVQIRGVSNAVGVRNKKEWRIPAAMNSAAAAVMQCVEGFSKTHAS